MSRKKKKRPHIVVGHDGEPCPRCGRLTEIREHRRGFAGRSQSCRGVIMWCSMCSTNWMPDAPF
jgi:hypothetical protein